MDSLLAAGICGVVKVAATTMFTFPFLFVNAWGCEPLLFASAVGMGAMFFIAKDIRQPHWQRHSPTPPFLVAKWLR
jgi:hypothetical protein